MSHEHVITGKNWYHIPQPEVRWLVDGLIPANGSAAAVGKPKSGKSAYIRNLVAAVVKGRPILGRSVDIPAGTGRVLYIHLDRKDKPHQVAKELRDLEITEEESQRVQMRFEGDVKSDNYAERLKWLQDEVTALNPHLIVIDLLWYFVVAENSNDYLAVQNGITKLHDALNRCKYTGAIIVAMHGRKAVSSDDWADDILGSTSQRGSFSTLLMFKHYKNEQRYTVASDQTERDEIYGEIPETIVTRNPDHILQLGQPVAEIAKAEHRAKKEGDIQRLLSLVSERPGIEMEGILAGLSISKSHALKLLREVPELIRRHGTGVKGDSFKYYDSEYEVAA